MSVFYVLHDDKNSVRRCKESRDDRKVIAIAGLTSKGRDKTFAGVVQAVQHVNLKEGRRWRITISDEATNTESNFDR